MTDTSSTTNRLGAETSPYLLQHADNPVDWFAWGDEALALAEAQNKPILLSIGYSACHWCHVMAHESFEDETIAALMNASFINIKVDREERPDIDKIYQTAHQLIAQRAGGWPLTMFLTPGEQLPFFGGTYFPNERRHGMPSFPEVLQRVAGYYQENAAEARAQGRELANVFHKLEPASPDEGLQLSDRPVALAREQLESQFNATTGGFGEAPKFPHTPSLERLLHHWRASASASEPDVQALYMTALSLKRMADGGIYDHLGGGFCRYTVDADWHIPHFEKMLYDNGLLLSLYCELTLASGDPEMRDVAVATADWLLRDLRSPEGAFYSSFDADSDGVEGAFYVWTPGEVRALVHEEDYPVFAMRFGLDGGANFDGAWHLVVRKSYEEITAALGVETANIDAALARSKKILLDTRAERVWPARDDKILTSWNALAVRSLAMAGRALGRADFSAAARTGLDFIARELLVDGRLYATFKDGRSRFPAYLDDHAFCLDATLEVLQDGWDPSLADFATTLADILLLHFEDRVNGGFYFTADDHEKLLHRARPFADDATPSGNGIAARALARLGFVLGEQRYLDAAENTLRAAWRPMTEYPHGHVTLISALAEFLAGSEVVILRGAEATVAEWAGRAAALYAPHRITLPIPDGTADLPGNLALRVSRPDGPVAYICRGTTCSLPLATWEAFVAELRR